jgi:hypothetical protein
MMNKIAEGILAVANALVVSNEPISHKESATSSVEGQAQEAIQDESCLTEEGQLAMIELLADSGLARTYLTLRSDTLRTKWIKKKLMEKALDLEIHFIDWESTQ